MACMEWDLNSFDAKIQIMRNTKSLKGTKIYITDDCIYKEREIRRMILEKMEDIKELNKNAKIKIYSEKMWIDKVYVWSGRKNNLTKESGIATGIS